jgi:hypothetical protein
MDKEEKRLTSKNSAKTIVDTIFDASLFREDVTRDQMNIIEGLVDLMIESYAKSWTASQEFIQSLKNKK